MTLFVHILFILFSYIPLQGTSLDKGTYITPESFNIEFIVNPFIEETTDNTVISPKILGGIIHENRINNLNLTYLKKYTSKTICSLIQFRLLPQLIDVPPPF